MENYSEFLKSKEWRELREKRIKRDGGKCVLCGKTENLVCHHINYSNVLDIESIVTVCDRCHEDIHGFMAEVKKSMAGGKLNELMCACADGVAEIADKYIFARDKNFGGDDVDFFRGDTGRLNRYINALFNWNPYISSTEILSKPYKLMGNTNFSRYVVIRSLLCGKGISISNTGIAERICLYELFHSCEPAIECPACEYRDKCRNERKKQ